MKLKQLKFLFLYYCFKYAKYVHVYFLYNDVIQVSRTNNKSLRTQINKKAKRKRETSDNRML